MNLPVTQGIYTKNSDCSWSPLWQRKPSSCQSFIPLSFLALVYLLIKHKVLEHNLDATSSPVSQNISQVFQDVLPDRWNSNYLPHLHSPFTASRRNTHPKPCSSFRRLLTFWSTLQVHQSWWAHTPSSQLCRNFCMLQRLARSVTFPSWEPDSAATVRSA